MKKALSIIILALVLSALAPAAAQTADSIIFKVTAANPSPEKTQTVPIKVYLPAEVKESDVLDPAGLELEYDSEKSVYYLYKDEVLLAPKETITFAVRVKDVWVIPKQTIDALKGQAVDILKQLENSEHYAKAQEKAQAIYRLLSEITQSQSDPSSSSAEHIQTYHANSKLLGQVKTDISDMEKTLQEATAPGWIERIKGFFKR